MEEDKKNGKRGGTENVANIVGMCKALELSNENMEKYNKKLKYLSENFLSELENEKINFKLNGHPLKRLKGNINITIKGVDAESILLLLSERGFCISTASACSTNSKKISHVLKAIGLDEEAARSTIRITFGEENKILDVKYLVNELKNILLKLSTM